MSILDGMPRTEQERNEVLAMAAPMAAAIFAKVKFTPRQQSVIDLMNEGLSLADIMEISKDHRDALLLRGARLFQAGELEKARSLLTVLYQLEPLDSRVLYMLAAIIQKQGDLATAGKAYVHFLALDATNPDGYLRLGECFLAAKEYDEAASTFRTALALCEDGYGAPDSLAHARRMVDHLDDRLSAVN